jgi:hypothetical protein
MRVALCVFLGLFIVGVATNGYAQIPTQKKRHAEAAIIMSGNQLFDLCSHYKTNKAKGELGVACFMYISAVAQTLIVVQTFVLNDDTRTMQSPCAGKSVTEEQIADVVVKWLDDHPEKRDLPAPLLVMKSLNEAFPCN